MRGEEAGTEDRRGGGALGVGGGSREKGNTGTAWSLKFRIEV